MKVTDDVELEASDFVEVVTELARFSRDASDAISILEHTARPYLTDREVAAIEILDDAVTRAASLVRSMAEKYDPDPEDQGSN